MYLRWTSHVPGTGACLVDLQQTCPSRLARLWGAPVMQVAWAVVASTAGGAPPTSSACWSAVSVSRRSQDRHWLRDRRATYAAVLRVYTRIEFDLRSACYQDKRTRIDWAPWGAALASLSLVASEEVAAATSRFTEAMREFKTFDLGGKRTKDEGLQLAAQVLAQAQMGL